MCSSDLYEKLAPDGCNMPAPNNVYPDGKVYLQQPLPGFVCPTDVGDSTNIFMQGYTKNNYCINEMIGGNNSRVRIRDIVDGAGIGVEHRHIGPQRARDQKRPNREVLVPGALAGGGLESLIHEAFDTMPGPGLQRRAKVIRSRPQEADI